ncbi:hypothetical protein GIB67_008112 [Kingdonia uniflora]|uniref:DUF7903 domain-containing protein n=1 Tax=Kingdonia uniflora TaxID=39325 RepID=A0A7J7MSZ6_9MAGN|nr:hypothetical protein GIB67_008112 [Kingdonia uniflora]
MAYIPPHKRHSETSSSLTPAMVPPEFQRSSNQRPNQDRKKKSQSLQGKNIYAKHYFTKWFIFRSSDGDKDDVDVDVDVGDGDGDGDEVCGSIRLEPLSMESWVAQNRKESMVLVSDHSSPTDVSCMKISPWGYIAEKIESDFVASIEHLRNEMGSEEYKEVMKPSFVARFGKVLFHGLLEVNSQEEEAGVRCTGVGSRSLVMEIIRQKLESLETVAESQHGAENLESGDRGRMLIIFSDNIGLPESSAPFLQFINLSQTFPILSADGLDQLSSIEIIFSFMLEMEMNQVRNSVVDISCLDKNLDLRLMLSTKRILTTLTDDEINSLRTLIKSAVVNPEVKGGLQWPLGKESLGDRYSIVGAWHTKSTAFKSSSLRLKIRHADRFDFRTSFGEVTREVNLKMIGISKQIKAETEGRMELEKQLASIQDTIRALQAQITANSRQQNALPAASRISVHDRLGHRGRNTVLPQIQQEPVLPRSHINPPLPARAVIDLQPQEEQNREKP